jgi:hypothetical protein
MWLFGYTDPFGGDSPIDVFYGEASTFVVAVECLYDRVQKDAKEAEKYEASHYDQILGAIRMVRDNPDIRCNPDMWYETTFTDKIGEVEYLVTKA